MVCPGRSRSLPQFAFQHMPLRAPARLRKVLDLEDAQISLGFVLHLENLERSLAFVLHQMPHGIARGLLFVRYLQNGEVRLAFIRGFKHFGVGLVFVLHDEDLCHGSVPVTG